MITTPTLDRQAFRAALGSFATGVTVITTRAADGTPVGLTANSFNSVSLDPPMVLWSLARKSLSLPVFCASSHWVVHVLAADQEALSGRFARSGEDKFAGLEIGRVQRIFVDPDDPSRIKVIIGVNHDFALHGGTFAIISQKGLVGDNYIMLDLDPPVGPVLAPVERRLMKLIEE